MIGVYWGGFVIIIAPMQDLLHVEEIFKKYINKINIKSLMENGSELLVLLENLNELGLIKIVL